MYIKVNNDIFKVRVPPGSSAQNVANLIKRGGAAALFIYNPLRKCEWHPTGCPIRIKPTDKLATISPLEALALVAT